MTTLNVNAVTTTDAQLVPLKLRIAKPCLSENYVKNDTPLKGLFFLTIFFAFSAFIERLSYDLFLL